MPSEWAAGAGAMIEPPPGADGQPPSESDRLDQEADWKLALAQAAQASRAAGRMPGFMEEIVRDALRPKAPWQSILRDFMTHRSKDDYSWRVPNKRFIGDGLYLPSAYSETIERIVFFFDTSASVDSLLLAQFVAEANAILEEVNPEAMTLIQCDVRVTDVRELTADDLPFNPPILGRGGTLFQPAFDWVEENFQELPACAVYCTDMEPGDIPRDPGYPVLWADFAGGHAPDMPFGERVVIE
jgi:predicted metal-dependent peptidase